jgi:hypothetical protein
MLDEADLPDRVRRRARAVFSRLGEVEAAIHGIDPADVELHEVGALDSIVDVVGVCAGLEALDIDDVWCSPIAVGHGSVRSAHGVIPNPAPATVALLSEVGCAHRRAGHDARGIDAHRRRADDDARVRLRRHAGNGSLGLSATEPAPPTPPSAPTSCRW